MKSSVLKQTNAAPSWHYRVNVAWGDMDAFGHVNNCKYALYVESARVQYCIGVSWMGDDGGLKDVGPIVKDLSIKYRKPIVFPATLDLYTHIGGIGKDRMTMFTTVRQNDSAVAEAKATVVSYDYTKGAPCAIPEHILRHITQTEAR